ncbi:hypothetical protein HYT23_02870 [Candidatus Pacearchaeota archaeon]|nr:hypothetical protein [Candidatus Pacearchaeota archaeon]
MPNKFFRILSFFIFPACVFFLSWFIDLAFNAYFVYPWIDIPMHFLGGFSIAYTAFLFLRFFREKGKMEINNKALTILIVVSLVALTAVLWEFYEFLKYLLDISLKPNIEDTLLDLFIGLLGGLTGSAVFGRKH